MSRSLPARPNLDHLKSEAKALHKALRDGDPSIKLTDAQRQLAREYGFPTWAQLRAHVASAREVGQQLVAPFLRAIQEQDLDRALAIVEKHPELRSSIHAMAALGISDAVRELLESNPHAVNEKAGDHPATPLLFACFTPRYRDPDHHLSME